MIRYAKDNKKKPRVNKQLLAINLTTLTPTQCGIALAAIQMPIYPDGTRFCIITHQPNVV